MLCLLCCARGILPRRPAAAAAAAAAASFSTLSPFSSASRPRPFCFSLSRLLVRSSLLDIPSHPRHHPAVILHSFGPGPQHFSSPRTLFSAKHCRTPSFFGSQPQYRLPHPSPLSNARVSPISVTRWNSDPVPSICRNLRHWSQCVTSVEVVAQPSQVIQHIAIAAACHQQRHERRNTVKRSEPVSPEQPCCCYWCQHLLPAFFPSISNSDKVLRASKFESSNRAPRPQHPASSPSRSSVRGQHPRDIPHI